jgi:predicted transcriptional regulator
MGGTDRQWECPDAQHNRQAQVVHDVLNVCNNGSINKTAIMYRSNLSYRQLARYLQMLQDREMIHLDDEGAYHITADGEKTLRRVTRLIRSIRELQKELEPDYSPPAASHRSG